MRSLKAACWAAAVLCCAVSYAQPRDGEGPRRDGPRDGERREGPRDGERESFVDRMMRLDRNGDGKIAKDELTDERINRLFARADADKDDVVTAEELKTLETAEGETFGRRGGRGPDGLGGRGPGGPERGPGGPPRAGFGPPRGGEGPRDGFGPPGGMMGPPRPGEVLPRPLQDMLDLSAEQKEQLADLQKDVDARLEELLTESQRNRLKEMRERRFGGPGGPGGPPRGEGGPRPEDRGDRRPPRDDR